MEHDAQKNSIDFFKKQIALEAEQSNSIKIWAMILFTINQTFSRIKLVHFLAITAMVIGSILVADYVHHSDTRAVLEKNQQEFNQAEQVKKESKVQAEATLTAEKQALVVKQQVEAIAKITPDQMNSIKAYITKIRDKEIAKLNEVYWTYVFINNTDKSLNMEMVNKIVRDQINVVNSFYKNRLFEVTSTYDFVKAGHVELVSPTHDNADGLEKVIIWETLAKTDSAPYLPTTEKIVAESTQFLRSPVKLNQYLEENKAMIENNKIFK
jgi:hypothetical protein